LSEKVRVDLCLNKLINAFYASQEFDL